MHTNTQYGVRYDGILMNINLCGLRMWQHVNIQKFFIASPPVSVWSMFAHSQYDYICVHIFLCLYPSVAHEGGERSGGSNNKMAQPNVCQVLCVYQTLGSVWMMFG